MLDRSRKADKRKEEKAKGPSSKKVKHGEKEKEQVAEEVLLAKEAMELLLLAVTEAVVEEVLVGHMEPEDDLMHKVLGFHHLVVMVVEEQEGVVKEEVAVLVA